MVDTKIDSTIMLADSAASCHVTNSQEGMSDVRKSTATMKIGDGSKMIGSKVGSKRGVIVRADGTTQDVTIADMEYVSNSEYNLFSLTKAMNAGYFLLGNMKEGLILKKNDTEFCFDRKIKAGKG